MRCNRCGKEKPTTEIVWKEKDRPAIKLNLCKQCLYNFEGRDKRGFKTCNFGKFFSEGAREVKRIHS